MTDPRTLITGGASSGKSAAAAVLMASSACLRALAEATAEHQQQNPACEGVVATTARTARCATRGDLLAHTRRSR